MKIAIIGSGISGMATSWLLNREHEIDLYEKNNYIGGHSNTVEINYNNKKIAVDTGFIVFNHQTYPNLKALFEILGVRTKTSDMSFSVSIDKGKIEYSGKNLATLFCQKKNIFNWKFLFMIKDILKFNKNAYKILESDKNPTIEEFIDDLKMGSYFQKFYLLPMSAAIWSCPLEVIKKYPAKSLVKFFQNHGLLKVIDQPQWFTVEGGSKEYVKLLCDDFKERIFLNSEIKKINKLSDGKLEVAGKVYDKIVLACHSNQALNLIDDFGSDIKNLLRQIKYQKNIATLHCDENLMPKNKKAWASWNYLRSCKDKQNEGLNLTYWMNILQGIDKNYPLFVSLNSSHKINKKKIFAEFEYEHPIFDSAAIAIQKDFEKIQGLENLYFCGAYLRYGFHEDGLLSAMNVAKKFGVHTPWNN
jgi:predicted NAD/FAD-binding protein